MTDNKLAMYQAKQNFVNNLVRPMLMNAAPEIIDCRYSVEFHPKNADWVNETVVITYEGGGTRTINVIGDSHRAIIKDIVKQGGLDG